MNVKVRPLTVGPILGATTGRSARVWGRGALELLDGDPRRCFGVVRVRPASSSHFRQPVFCKMNPNFDMTGLVLLEDLIPEKEYVYEMGYFFSDLDLDDLGADYPLNWDDIAAIAFRSAAEDTIRARSFVFGSCRYLLRLFGGSWFDKRGDKTFRAILGQIDQGVQTDLVLMTGDQIYADDLAFIAPDQTLDAFNERYRDAFAQPHIRKLMSRVPTYMTLDDHEIEDAWPANATAKDFVIKYPAAIHAYQTYQMSHSPLLPMVSDNHMSGVPEKYWYTFSDGCCDFFVSDVRTERYLSNDVHMRRIMSDEQLQALMGWLADGSGQVKCVVTSVPFFPDPISSSDGEDKWAGFLRQRDELLDLVCEEEIPRVVFLAGDYHFSMKSELSSPDKPGFKILSIISSSFFWPYPHGSLRSYQVSGPLATLSDHNYEVVNSSAAVATDNFTRVTVDREQLGMEIFSRKGDLLGKFVYRF